MAAIEVEVAHVPGDAFFRPPGADDLSAPDHDRPDLLGLDQTRSFVQAAKPAEAGVDAALGVQPREHRSRPVVAFTHFSDVIGSDEDLAVRLDGEGGDASEAGVLQGDESLPAITKAAVDATVGEEASDPNPARNLGGSHQTAAHVLDDPLLAEARPDDHAIGSEGRIQRRCRRGCREDQHQDE